MIERQPKAISEEQTVEILSGPRTIPPEILGRVGMMLQDDTPIVDMDRFDECMELLYREKVGSTLPQTMDATYKQIIKLGSSSIEMAWLLAGDINIPRPRRLGEHDQSVLNVYKYSIEPGLTQSRDRVLKPSLLFQDAGKSFGVAIDGHNKNQAVHNGKVIRNIVPHSDVLSKAEKAAIPLIAAMDILGPAIYHHAEKGHSLDDVATIAHQKREVLRRKMPGLYQDRIPQYIDAAYRADAGAHTQHPAARYKDAKTGRTFVDITNRDRDKCRNGTDTTLDLLFSEKVEHRGKLVFQREKDIEAIREILPELYG